MNGGGPLTRLLGRLLALAFVVRRAGRPRPGAGEDPRERRLVSNPRVEVLVAALLLLCAACGVGMLFVYLFADDTQLLGLMLGLALTFASAALIVSGKLIVPQEVEVEQRPQLERPEEDAEVEGHLRAGTEGITRRGLLAGSAGAAGAGLGLAFIVPAASVGPAVGELLDETPWRRGRYIVDEHGKRIKADDLEIGDWITGFPEGAYKDDIGAPVVIVRMRSEEIELPPERAGWAPEGLLAFSKVCTHAGCAVSGFRYPLYEPTTKEPALMCPCHYSTFLPQRGGTVQFGPAGRPLPQLPLSIDPRRELVADGPFSGPPGPSWWSVRMPKGTD